MNKILITIKAPLLCGALILAILNSAVSFAQIDTLHVLSYSVLYLGDTPPCQAPHDIMEGYIKTVIAYANPDITGFVKAEAIGTPGSAPTGFADSILQNIFNAAYPGKYASCSYTNTSGASNITLLFYNQQKLGFAGMLCSYSKTTDFDTWKLYYKSANLATTHDSIFLYVTLNHTSSGSGNAAAREEQIAGEMAQIETHFLSLPNMINMGDFNTQNSSEACYQTLVAPTDAGYKYYDPPFYPDATFVYPGDWSNNPSDYASYLTVSTRETTSSPNGCSTDVDGGKSWYDHIFLSANIINNADHISYIPHSFKVVGNDGNRVGIAVNASPTNTSAPSDVVNDIFQISEHYPIALDLLVDTSTLAAASISGQAENVTVVNPVDAQLMMKFTNDLVGKTISIICVDMLGRMQMNNIFVATNGMMHLPCTLIPGIYYLKVCSGNNLVANVMISKK